MTVLRARDAFAARGRSAVRHAVASGRWQRPALGVYVTHNGPLSRFERWEVALLANAPGSAIGGVSALELDGLRGFQPDTCFLVLPEGAGRLHLPGTVSHWSTRLDESEVHPLHTPRRTRPERSVMDAASWTGSDRHARAIVLAARQQGIVSERGMHAVVDRRATVKRAGLVRESVLDAGGGIQSLPEKHFDELLLVAGLPRPNRQRAVRGREGRYFLDAEWKQYGVSAEIHGLPHHGVVQWSYDLIRSNEIGSPGRVCCSSPRTSCVTSRPSRSTSSREPSELAGGTGSCGRVRSCPARSDGPASEPRAGGTQSDRSRS